MSHVHSSLSARRRALARRLTLRAALSLGSVLAFALGSAVAALVALGVLIDSALAGRWGETGLALVLATVAALTARTAFGWLHAPDARPDAVHLPRRVARSLHRKVDRMAERFGGVRIDAVWVTGDMNAAILQQPRWGLCGPMETHLLIGLPLAHSVSHRQLSAVLAHEFAHLAVQRKGAAAWGRHLRSWWFRVVDRCAESLPLLGPLLDRLTVGDLVAAMQLSRLEEFEADEIAAQMVGSGLVAETLVEVALKERFLMEDYWRGVMERTEAAPSPTIRPYRDMGHGMIAGFRRPSEHEWGFDSLFEGDDGAFEPHPSIPERLAALGAVPVLGSVVEHSAAVRLLAPLLPSLSRVFDRIWWAQVRPSWRERYRYGLSG